MPQLRISEAAAHLGVSADTLRRWIDRGTLTAHHDDSGRLCVDGHEVALAARAHYAPVAPAEGHRSSARNRMVGLVTQITRDTVMAQVEIQCGPHRIVSLMSSESVDDLGLEPGSVAVATIKSTNVIVEVEQ
ncbi:TOBE domain-containing protein [Nocardioides dubius]|uniref:Helix-turn-helix transcriptional regulator n=1 Tax=Nocardioides dubius TaxID=317019 RepID=A0ABN1TL61_9ACTN